TPAPICRQTFLPSRRSLPLGLGLPQFAPPPLPPSRFPPRAPSLSVPRRLRSNPAPTADVPPPPQFSRHRPSSTRRASAASRTTPLKRLVAAGPAALAAEGASRRRWPKEPHPACGGRRPRSADCRTCEVLAW
ncbi:hypothetical protein PVAP13_8KG111608, partial [Panicum virgatum]